MPLRVAPSAVAVIADAQPLLCAACLCGKEGEGERGERERKGEGERGRGGERVLTMDSVYVVHTYDPSHATKGDVY